MCVNNLPKVALDNAEAGIEPAISNRSNHYATEPRNSTTSTAHKTTVTSERLLISSAADMLPVIMFLFMFVAVYLAFSLSTSSPPPISTWLRQLMNLLLSSYVQTANRFKSSPTHPECSCSNRSTGSKIQTQHTYSEISSLA